MDTQKSLTRESVSVCVLQFFSDAQQIESRFAKLLHLVRYDTGSQHKQSDIKQLIDNIKVCILSSPLRRRKNCSINYPFHYLSVNNDSFFESFRLFSVKLAEIYGNFPNANCTFRALICQLHVKHVGLH